MTNRQMLLGTAAIIAAGVSALLFIVLLDLHDGPAILIESDPDRLTIVVEVSGAVATPGVYTLPSDARVNDVILAAGGLTSDADTTAINLAERVDDEERIAVPRIAPVSAAIPVSTSEIGQPRPTPMPAQTGKVDINSADAGTLETLPKIGPVLAQRIVDFRDSNGPFASVDELAQVDGISSNMVDDLRELITVGS